MALARRPAVALTLGLLFAAARRSGRPAAAQGMRPESSEPDPDRDSSALVGAFGAAWDASNLDALLALFAPNGEVRYVGYPGALSIYAGEQRLRRWLGGGRDRRVWRLLAVASVLPQAGRARWVGIPADEGPGAAMEHDSHPVTLVFEAELARDGRIAVLGVARAADQLVHAWDEGALSVARAPAASPAGAPAAPAVPAPPPLVELQPPVWGDAAWPLAFAALGVGAYALRLARRRSGSGTP